MQAALRDYAGARASHEQALGIFRKALPAGHPHIAESLNNLGNVQYALRDYAGARASHEQALGIRRKALPPDHPDIAESLNNLGIVQYELRDYAGARASHEQALGIRRKALPPDHPDIATSLNNLGVVQTRCGTTRGPGRATSRPWASSARPCPRTTPTSPQSLNNLGIVQYALRDYAGARASFEQALGIRRKALPPDHPDIADEPEQPGGRAGTRCGTTRGRGRATSRPWASAARPCLRTTPTSPQSLNNLGAVQDALRDYAGARASHEQALGICRKALPPGHPDIAESLNNLGLIDVASGGLTADTATRLGEALAITQSHLLALAGSQAEDEQLRAAAAARDTLSLYLSAALAPGAKTAAAAVYDRAAGLKGLVTARQRWARELRDAADPDTRRLLDELQTVNLRLLRAAVGSDRLSGASPERPTDPAAELARLDADRTDLERRLAARSAAFRRYQEKAKLGGAAVRAALPKGVCLVDFLEYAHVGPPPAGKADPVVEPRLAAFVVRPGTSPCGSSTSGRPTGSTNW